MTESTGTIITASGRTLEEMKAGIRIRMRNMVNSALEIGFDLMEAKDACRHGEWMPFLKDIGLSASTAANYMRIAKEVSADSKMATLPYTKILALLAAPPEEREELAAAAEDMSAAEIRRLTEERNRAAEAANTESARADQAEREAKEYYDEIASLRTKVQSLEVKAEEAYQRGQDDTVNMNRELSEKISLMQIEKDELGKELHEARCDLTKSNEAYERQKRRIDELRGQLLEAENHVVEVEKAPADYEALKQSQADLIEAAADAEKRAADAEAELDALRAGDGAAKKEKPAGIALAQAMNAFFRECEMMPFNPAELQRDSFAVKHCIESIREWCQRMDDALNTPVILEASVI